MKEEAISSSGDPLLVPKSSSPPTPTPAASSVGASSPAVPATGGSIDWLGHGQASKAGSHPMRASLSSSAGGSAHGSSYLSCRPWERGDLLRRLSTFNPTNWFAKPKAASSLACARRGWVNVDVDEIECESCGEKLKFISSVSCTPTEADNASEDFAKQLDAAHRVTCPWIGNSCAESLVQFPSTPPSALIGGYKDRCDGLLQFSSLPVVATSAIEQMRISRGPEIDRFLVLPQASVAGESLFKSEIMSATDNSKEDIFGIYSHMQKLISLCGWEARWLPNVQDCEEHSAQSARNGCSIGPIRHRGPLKNPVRRKKALSTSTKNETLCPKPRFESRSPLLDCSLCGATVRIWEFLTVTRPTSFTPNNVDIPETSKKMALTRGMSAASGINGWVATEGVSSAQLHMTGGLSSAQLHMTGMTEQDQEAHVGQHQIRQPSSSEVGDRAASHESRGPSTRKRNLDEGGSTVDRPQLVMQQADSVEGTVIDRDGDEVNDGKQFIAGPSKRPRESVVFETHNSYIRKNSSGAGPSHSIAPEIAIDALMDDPFDQVNEQVIGNAPTWGSTHVSSVIAMDTVYRSDDSMESVENFPGDIDDAHFSSVTVLRNPDLNDTSELNYSNPAQQSTCPTTSGRVAGEMGVTSKNVGEEVLNADTATARVRDGPSIGISGGSVGMGASHEAEIHEGDLFVHRADSFVGDVEPVAEVSEKHGQTGEFAPDRGHMGEFVPEEMDREDPQGDSQDIMSRSMGSTDSGSKIVGTAKEQPVESGEKTSNMRSLQQDNSMHPSLSCNAILCSGYEVSKEEVTQEGKALATDDGGCSGLGYLVANEIGPPNGESNYQETVEFDPIKHHNHFCPWVNGNVAAAGCISNNGPSSSAGAIALCGWQLTIDALDAFQSLGHIPVQTVESESAASLYKDDHLTRGQKLLAPHSFSKTRGQS